MTEEHFCPDGVRKAISFDLPPGGWRPSAKPSQLSHHLDVRVVRDRRNDVFSRRTLFTARDKRQDKREMAEP